MGALDGLAGLQVLVDLEEVGDLQPVEVRDVADVLHGGVARVVGGDAQDLLVRALLVLHHEHADGPALDGAAGEGGFAGQDERVEGVPVAAG